MIPALSIVIFCALAASSQNAAGVIEGTVVNGSYHETSVTGAVVVLRAEYQGSLLAVAETTTDKFGRFRFEPLPVGDGMVWLPGANHQGIHYPGSRIQLDRHESPEPQRIVIYETVDDPSPLVAARHEIDIRAELGVLVVTETILVANRTTRSYVGLQTDDGNPPVTLRLSIPMDFEKVTFEKEFFGRQFELNEHGLATHIPWTPGMRKLKFTYRLPLESRQLLFHRTLDLPTEQVAVNVVGCPYGDVTSNLGSDSSSERETAAFEYNGSILPVGHTIEIELGSLSVPWTAYARWIALASLVLAVLGTATHVLLRRRSLTPRNKASTETEPSARVIAR
jgi:hypothetical protein